MTAFLTICMLGSTAPAWMPTDTLSALRVTPKVHHSWSLTGVSGDYLITVRLGSTTVPDEYDLTQDFSLGLRGASRVGYGRTPFAHNGWMYATEPSYVAVGIIGGRRLMVSISKTSQTDNEAQVPLSTPEARHLWLDRLFREAAARQLGEQLAAAGSVTIGSSSLNASKESRKGTEYIRIRDFANASQAVLTPEPDELRISITRGSKSFLFAWGTPFYRVQNTWYPMPDGMAWSDGSLWIPVATARKFLGN